MRSAGSAIEKLFERPAVDRLTAVAATPLALGNLANAALMKAFEFSQRKVNTGIIDAVIGPAETKVRAVGRRG